MSYERHTEKKGDYLLIRYTGSLAIKDLPRGQNVFQNIADLCRQNECKKVLLDSRELTIDLGTMDLYQIGSLLAETRGSLVKFSILGTDEQVPSDNFMENVAVNRGGFVRVFTVEDEGIAWLSEA